MVTTLAADFLDTILMSRCAVSRQQNTQKVQDSSGVSDLFQKCACFCRAAHWGVLLV